jgi:exonuclease SbcD
LADLLRDPALRAEEAAWCQVTLTDAQRPADAMQRLRTRFPHTLELRLRPEGVPSLQERTYVERVSGRSDVDVCCGFVEHVRGRTADEAEVGWLREALAAGRLVEVEESGVAAERAVRRETAAAAVVAARQEVAAAEALTLLDLPDTARRAVRRPAARPGSRGAHDSEDQQLSLEDVG